MVPLLLIFTTRLDWILLLLNRFLLLLVWGLPLSPYLNYFSSIDGAIKTWWRF
jgi:hypothetical protein